MTAPAGALATTLAKLPDQPGVYLMQRRQGPVLYVGKAQSLRNRVRQYWQQARRGQPPLRIESGASTASSTSSTR